MAKRTGKAKGAAPKRKREAGKCVPAEVHAEFESSLDQHITDWTAALRAHITDLDEQQGRKHTRARRVGHGSSRRWPNWRSYRRTGKSKMKGELEEGKEH